MSEGERNDVVARVRLAVTAFEGVAERLHDDHALGWGFTLDETELGRVHDDGTVHVLLPRRERDHVVAAGLARPLRSAPRSGWVEFIPACTDDALAAAAIFRRAWRAAARRVAVPA